MCYQFGETDRYFVQGPLKEQHNAKHDCEGVPMWNRTQKLP